MARKRLVKRTVESRSAPDKKTVPRSSKTISNDFSSSVKVILLIIIGICIIGFLFYPDISNLVNSMKNTKDDPVKYNDERDRDASLNSDNKKSKRREDLMEEEENGGYIADTNDDDADEEDISLDVTKEKKDEKKKTEKNEQTYVKFEPGKTGSLPIKIEDDSQVPKTKSKPKSKSNDKTKKNSASENKRNKEKDELPDEIKNFKAKYQKTLTAKKIFSGGRRIPPVELLHQKETNSSVKVYLFDDFLSQEECDGLRDAHDRHVEETSKLSPILCFDSVTTLNKHLKDAKKKIKVTPNVFTEGTKCVNATFSNQLSQWFHSNWSYSTAFYPGENKFSYAFADRVQQAMGLDPDNGGKIQLTSYPVGKAYKTHTDCTIDGVDKRDRFATVLVYLSDVKKGGETKFPDLGIWVKPRKGRALVWNNMDENGKCDPLSAHVASKVEEGQKYVLIRWYYYKNFYSLGKRPTEPELPRRIPGAPKVSCDEYEMGSCRWYDEWNYDHLLDYERQKLTLV